MAFSVLAAPQLIHPAYNPSQFWVYDDINDVLGFRYVFVIREVQLQPTPGIGDIIATIKVAPQLDGKGFVDISKFLQSFVSNNIPQKNIGQGFDNSNWKFADEGNSKQYTVVFQIEHISFAEFDSIQNSGGLIRINFIAGHTFAVNDTIEIISDTQVGLLPFRTVVSVDTNYIVIDQNWSTVSGTTDGTVYYADRRITNSGDLTRTSAFSLPVLPTDPPSIENFGGYIRINNFQIDPLTDPPKPYIPFVKERIFINSTNPGLNGPASIIEKTDTYIVIDKLWDSLTITTASGTVSSAITIGPLTLELGIIRRAYNEALSFQRFPTFDTNRIQLLPDPVNPDEQRILTNFPRTGGTIKPYQNMWWNFLHRQDEGVNCIFFRNDAGDLFRMNTDSPDNDDHFIKQVNVSPDANIIPVGSSTFPLVKPNTKYYEVWAESSCCAEFCETLDVNFTVSGSTSPVVIDGDYTFIATNVGDDDNPIWQYEASFDGGVTTSIAYVRRSDTLPNTWEHYTINPLTSEEVVFAVQNDYNCWNFSYCLEIPCMELNMTFVMGGEAYTQTFVPTGYDSVNNKFIYSGTFNATPTQQGFIYPPYFGPGRIVYDQLATIGRIEWNPTTERWEYVGWTESVFPTKFVIAYTEDDLCNESIWITPAPDCGANEPQRIFARIDGNLVTFKLTTTTLTPSQRVYTARYVDPTLTLFELSIYYDNTNGWTMSEGAGLGTPLYNLPSTAGFPEDCPIDVIWNDLGVGTFDSFETYDYYEGVDSTTSAGQVCDTVEAENDGNGNLVFTITHPYLPGWEGNYQVKPQTILSTEFWVLENLDGNTIVGGIEKTDDIPPIGGTFIMDGEPDTIIEFYSDFRCYDPNVCPNDVSYEYILEPNVYPEITTNSSCSEEEQTRTSEIIRINIDHDCPINTVQLLFQDRSGSWGSFGFPLRVQETGTVNKKSYRQKIGGLGPDGYTYQTFENEKPVYHSEMDKTYKLSTGWLTDEMSLYFEELLSSPNVYINFGDYNEDYFPTSNPWLACEIVDNSFETPRTRNKKLIRREVTIKLSSKNTINV